MAGIAASELGGVSLDEALRRHPARLQLAEIDAIKFALRRMVDTS